MLWFLKQNLQGEDWSRVRVSPHRGDAAKSSSCSFLFVFVFFPAVEQEVFPVQGLCLFVLELDWIRYLQHAAVYSVWHTKAICREMIPLWHLGEEYESIMPKCCSCLSSCGTKQGFSQGFRGEGAVVGIMVSGSQQNTRNSWERALI